MKKNFMIYMLLSFMAVSVSAQAPFDRGDVNGDGNVDISDVVSLVNIILEGDVHLTCPDNHHPHAIDLDLPSGTKWACCNVGASSPEGYGGYYAWGETGEKSEYTWENYAYNNSSTHDYSNIGSDYTNIGSNIAGTQYDVAHVKWGGEWKMPTKEQCDELCNNCTYQWTTVNGISGGKFIGSNGSSIFLPAVGCRWESYLDNAGSGGYYWSSNQYSSGSNHACYLYIYSGGADTSNRFLDRCIGQGVRPVR